MDRVGFLGFFNSPREAAEAWMRSLAKTASVRKARAKAEVEFRSREVAANWRDWRGRLGEMIEFDPSRFENHIPPHMELQLWRRFRSRANRHPEKGSLALSRSFPIVLG